MIKIGMVVYPTNVKNREDFLGVVTEVNGNGYVRYKSLDGAILATQTHSIGIYYLQVGDKFLLDTGIICTIENFILSPTKVPSIVFRSKDLKLTKELKKIAKQLKKFYD